MSKGKNFIFITLHVVAWLIFVGLCIEAGAIIVNFVFSLFKPEFVANLYQKLDLSEMHNRSLWAYFLMYGFIMSISVLKAILFYVVIRLLIKLDLSNPFSTYVSRQISLLSYFTLAIGILSFVAREAGNYLAHNGYEIDKLDQFWSDSQAFIIMAAVIYIIATIFSKGVEIQNENNLTV